MTCSRAVPWPRGGLLLREGRGPGPGFPPREPARPLAGFSAQASRPRQEMALPLGPLCRSLAPRGRPHRPGPWGLAPAPGGDAVAAPPGKTPAPSPMCGFPQVEEVTLWWLQTPPNRTLKNGRKGPFYVMDISPQLLLKRE